MQHHSMKDNLALGVVSGDRTCVVGMTTSTENATRQAGQRKRCTTMAKFGCSSDEYRTLLENGVAPLPDTEALGLRVVSCTNGGMMM